MFNKSDYVKIIDTHGNFRFGYIAENKLKGSLLTIDLCDEGLNKIEWDEEYASNVLDGDTKIFFDIRRKLTDIENKIIRLLADLYTMKDIAGEMKISPVTVRAHIRDLKNKLQLTTREQLIAYSQGICKKYNDHNRNK